jgi:hypothetical protein
VIKYSTVLYCYFWVLYCISRLLMWGHARGSILLDDDDDDDDDKAEDDALCWRYCTSTVQSVLYGCVFRTGTWECSIGVCFCVSVRYRTPSDLLVTCRVAVNQRSNPTPHAKHQRLRAAADAMRSPERDQGFHGFQGVAGHRQKRTHLWTITRDRASECPTTETRRVWLQSSQTQG